MKNLTLAGHAESKRWGHIEMSINMPGKFNKQQIARGEKEKKDCLELQRIKVVQSRDHTRPKSPCTKKDICNARKTKNN